MATSLNTPTLSELVERIQTDMKAQLPESNPFLEKSAILAVLISFAGRYFENYTSINQLLLALFPTTSSDDFIDLWGAIFGIPRLTATPSVGTAIATGILFPTTSVAAGAQLQDSAGIIYEVQADATVQNTSTPIQSITSIGTTATVILSTPPAFATGISVLIAGVDQSTYNGTFPIVMINDSSFTYTLPTSAPSPATGTITAEVDSVALLLQSITQGSETNALSGTELTFVAITGGIDNNVAFVDFSALTGGEDEESDDTYRARILNRFAFPVANFSISSIEEECFKIQGVTRVSVLSTTPGNGEVTVYFVRDNDSNIIPTPPEVTVVKNQILTIQPAGMLVASLFVNAPTPINVNFEFNTLIPDTATLRDAIQANLQAYFRSIAIGQSVEKIAYDSVIFNSIDPLTGTKVQSFILVLPAGDVPINFTQVGRLGTVTYA